MFTKQYPKIKYFSRLLYLSLMLIIFAAFTFKYPNMLSGKSVIDQISKNELQVQGILKDTIEPVFQKTEIPPAFPGGLQGWRRFLEQNLKASTPVDNGAPAGAYSVIVQFIVDKEGKISDLKTLTKHGFGMEEEVLRMMRLSPNWIPAKENGKVVKAYRVQPITFVIREDKKNLPTTKAENRVQKLSGNEISAGDFKKLTINQLTRREKDDDLKTFELMTERGSVFNLGNEFSPEMKQLIQSVKTGDIVTLQSIKAIVNGKEQRLPSIYYVIK